MAHIAQSAFGAVMVDKRSRGFGEFCAPGEDFIGSIPGSTDEDAYRAYADEWWRSQYGQPVPQRVIDALDRKEPCTKATARKIMKQFSPREGDTPASAKGVAAYVPPTPDDIQRIYTQVVGCEPSVSRRTFILNQAIAENMTPEAIRGRIQYFVDHHNERGNCAQSSIRTTTTTTTTTSGSRKRIPAWVLPVGIGAGVIVLGSIAYFALRK